MHRFRLNRIGATHLHGDLFGGLTAAIVALPLALASGVASGAGPVAGLYGAIFVGLFAALFGGTPAQISGPTGPMTIIMASVFTQLHSRPQPKIVRGVGFPIGSTIALDTDQVALFVETIDTVNAR